MYTANHVWICLAHDVHCKVGHSKRPSDIYWEETMSYKVVKIVPDEVGPKKSLKVKDPSTEHVESSKKKKEVHLDHCKV